MVRLTKIYTRTGDGGLTRLVNGAQLPKDDPRIEAYGTVDELNAQVGVCRVALGAADLPAPLVQETNDWLEDVQQRLFDLGSDLATPMADRFPGQPIIEAAHITALERAMDAWNAELPPLTSFVLPGGGPLGAQLHVARTVCRRAERRVQTLRASQDLGEQALPYLNRLSDALFVLSRWVAKRGGEAEALWTR